LATLKAKGINAVFHYIPLHASEAGRKFGRTGSSMSVTENLSDRIIRLPLYPALTEDEIIYICATIDEFFRQGRVVS
jgi:dTDP-4-amino-4,6-dideoxygalactose transaminase